MSDKVTSINYVDKQGEGEFARCHQYYRSLKSNLVNGVRRGPKNSVNVVYEYPLSKMFGILVKVPVPL